MKKFIRPILALALLMELSGCYVVAPPPPAPVAYTPAPYYGAYYPAYPAAYAYPGYYAAPAVSVGLGFGGGGYWRHR